MLKISLSPTTAYNELGANEVIIDVSLVSYVKIYLAQTNVTKCMHK